MTRPNRSSKTWALNALRETEPACFWLEDPARPEPKPTLIDGEQSQLAIVGAGYTGLWTALLAKERQPQLDVVIVEAATIGHAASGRNGGFCDASLTHGLANGLRHFSDEMIELERLGKQNLLEIKSTLDRYDIDCSWEQAHGIDVATARWQLPSLSELASAGQRFGADVELLDGEDLRTRVASPTYLGGLVRKDSVALVHPAKLAWGLARACEDLGVRIYERTPVTGLQRTGGRVSLTTPYGMVSSEKVALATNAYSPLLKRMRLFVAPVYDYVLVTEPLTNEQLSAIGWSGREGLTDSGNQFHYYRLTPDNRILWGGYDAIYNFGNAVRPDLDHRPDTYKTLAKNFFETFPQLEGLRFTHSWGGVIDTCSRFSAFWGSAYRGRVAYCAGYTGLGVAATRFGANTMLDLLARDETERTHLKMVQRKPIPFPPEPLRWPIIELTRRSLVRADHNEGERNWWLKLLDRLGLGFNS